MLGGRGGGAWGANKGGGAGQAAAGQGRPLRGVFGVEVGAPAPHSIGMPVMTPLLPPAPPPATDVQTLEAGGGRRGGRALDGGADVGNVTTWRSSRRSGPCSAAGLGRGLEVGGDNRYKIKLHPSVCGFHNNKRF